MDYLQSVIQAVEKSHPGLGRLVAMTQITIKAQKMMLSVSPRGCGKSRVSSWVGGSYPGVMKCERFSVAALGELQEELTGFRGVIIIDDLAKASSDYARNSTVTVLAELVYGGEISSAMMKSVYEITDFKGAVIANIQPVLLKSLIASEDWEASVQDKTIRYYHLLRPSVPNTKLPDVKLEWGLHIESVIEPEKVPESLIQIGKTQWSRTRVTQHLRDLMRATAALNGHSIVTPLDIKLLHYLLQPLAMEALVLQKLEFESDRQLDNNALAILTEYYSYHGQFTVTDIAADYGLSESRARQILNQYSTDWVEISKSPATFAPSIQMQLKMQELGVELSENIKQNKRKAKHKKTNDSNRVEQQSIG